MTLAVRRSSGDPDRDGDAPARRGTHVALDGEAVPSVADTPSAGGPGHGRRRSASRHRRANGQSNSAISKPLLRIGAPALLIVVLLALATTASLLSPSHAGPMPTLVTLPLVLLAVPLVAAAALRLGLSSIGAVVAAALSSFLLPTASSDVVGVVEHLSVVLGLIAVVLWPPNAYGTVRRYLSSGVAGAAIATSPLAILAVGAVIGWLLRHPDDRTRRAKALVGPLATGLVVAGAGVTALAVTDTLSATTWAGNVSFATIVVALAPAFGVAGGLAADRSLAALGARSTKPLVIGSIGVVGLCLLLAATAGATIAQIRDRAVATEEAPANASIADSPFEPASPKETSAPQDVAPEDPAEVARRADDGAQLLQNPRLSVSDTARELLEDGAVDRRVMLVLAQLLAQHDLTVADFPESDGEAVRRSLLVTDADGDRLETGGASIPVLGSYLSGLTGDYAVETLSVDSDGVLAVFPPETAD
ncbi:hypothetical protein [Herbiconiux sp. L3-i23]|uniref:hypothetical protein n=1 Tax=Herbiconiux sp. L3-i23 TaxID=2905871 RepID=UPI0020698CDE|nr:hypothetical protein [Herbiconiux sp. L3-i23]BDI23089.1 hypothetical protein L3i23_18650 [Herbiconiux sp. L3-i23]